MKHLINALPLVAEALGRKYGVKVHIGGSRAYTDGRNIHIPALPLESDETTLNLARGYLDHEAAHLRTTDFQALKNSNMTGIERHVWNILEDFMVERKLAAIYPGCAQNFDWLAKRVFLDPESTVSPAEMVFDWILIGLRSLAVPELAIKKTCLKSAINATYPDLLRRLEPLVKAVPQSCQNTQSCIAMARKIVELIQKYVDSYPEPVSEAEKRPNGGNKRKRGQNAGKNGENPQDSTSQSAKNGKKEEQPYGSEERDEAVKCGKDQDSMQTGKESDNGEQEWSRDCEPLTLKELLADPTSMADSDMGALAGKMLEEVGQSLSSNCMEVAVPVKTVNNSLKPEDTSGIRSKTSALRTRLEGLLQSKVLSRNHIGRNGRSDTARIARLSTLKGGGVTVR